MLKTIIFTLLLSTITFASENLNNGLSKYKEVISKDINSFKFMLKKFDNNKDLVNNLDYLLESTKNATHLNELDFISLYYLDFKYTVESEIAYQINKKS